MSLPDLQGTLNLSAPVYLRMLDNRNDWGSAEDQIEKRVADGVKLIFTKRHKTPFSFYLIQSNEDLRRIVAAHTARRHHPASNLDLVAFLPDELAKAGITGKQAPGRTECGYANRRHYDMDATEEQLASLCNIAMSAERAAHRFAKATMRSIREEGQKERCAAVIGQQGSCHVEECIAQSPPA